MTYSWETSLQVKPASTIYVALWAEFDIALHISVIPPQHRLFFGFLALV
jgi:hypothetical protein